MAFRSGHQQDLVHPALAHSCETDLVGISETKVMPTWWICVVGRCGVSCAWAWPDALLFTCLRCPVGFQSLGRQADRTPGGGVSGSQSSKRTRASTLARRVA